MVESNNGGWIAATLLVIVLCFAIVALFLYSGAYDVAATAPDPGFVQRILAFTSDRSVHAHASEVKQAPPAADSAMLLLGAAHYSAMCVQCHGAPGHDRGEVGRGLYRTPPHLTHVFDRFDEREVFWVVKNGVKMTGMPAFGPTHDDAKIWAMVAFIHRFPTMSRAQFDAWVAAARAAGVGDDDAAAGRTATTPAC